MSNSFLYRHIGPDESCQRRMLNELGVTSLDALISRVVPESIRMSGALDIPVGISEEAALEELSSKLGENVVTKSMIGQGYHGTHVPPVIQRNLFENPAWYTAYTPYQPEISQGRLEMLFHYQTLVSELTSLPVVNASLLDEATAVAEAATMAFRSHNRKRPKIVVANDFHPQTVDVLKTRCGSLGIEIDCGWNAIDDSVCAVLVQCPDTLGVLSDLSDIISRTKESGALLVVSADPLSLVLLDGPGTWGADICVGSMQRFGVPLGNGGPHAAYLATTETLTRLVPGRLIGLSVDTRGREAYRLALQTREQHIRRDKATSNICTAQALLANMSAAYGIWHGPSGLRAIAERVHNLASSFADSILGSDYELTGDKFFDTVTVKTKKRSSSLFDSALECGFLLRVIDEDSLSVAFDETTTSDDLSALCEIFGQQKIVEGRDRLGVRRDTQNFMSQKVFHTLSSETDMMRFLRRLADKDLALDRAMIPLGSCTMKLNAAAEMMPVSWSSTSNIHPFAPASHRLGYTKMIEDLDRWLSSITGFAKVSFQPNAGSQGEYAGLLAISAYHKANGEGHRNVCLIPSSAHGTNPASADMVGYDVVVVKCTENGDVSLEDLKEKVQKHSDNLAALMVTYPSTHGVFEEQIKEVCSLVHEHGGQVYLDGANLNAMVGLARPGDIGGDVCHMNLHKTFCIPHGGGGPGIGPIGVAEHLVPYLPGHTTEDSSIGAVSAAPYGSASILPISWMYIRMLGGDGLPVATQVAILSANYVAHRLKEKYPILYTGSEGYVAHECIVDTRELKDKTGVTVDDIAKRLIDYGFHAPTMSFPVAGTLMVEPTESEPLGELDRLVDALLSIWVEASRIESEWSPEDNPLCNAPHSAEDVMSDDWTHPYPRSLAAFPVGVDVASKYWAPVSRVDNVHGDRNLICTCPPLEEAS